MDAEAGIFVSFKEWFEKIEKAQTEGFARVEKALESKADKQDVDEARRDLKELSTRVGNLEAANDAKRHQWNGVSSLFKIAGVIWGAATTVALILASAGVWHP